MRRPEQVRRQGVRREEEKHRPVSLSRRPAEKRGGRAISDESFFPAGSEIKGKNPRERKKKDVKRAILLTPFLMSYERGRKGGKEVCNLPLSSMVIETGEKKVP